MTKAFETHVRKTAKKADVSGLVEVLSGLILLRRKRKAIAAINASLRDPLSRPAPMASGTSVLGSATFPTRSRSLSRSSRRTRHYQSYEVTGKWNDARRGTFRHYMLATILKHTNTRDANAEHDNCDNPKFAKNKLDFSWAASNGYITLK